MRTQTEIINHLNAWQTRPNQIVEIDCEEYYQLSKEELKMIEELENEEE